MRILVYQKNMGPPHGAEVWTGSIIQGFERAGHIVSIFSRNFGQYYAQKLSHIRIFELAEQLNNERFDLFLVNHDGPITDILNKVSYDKIAVVVHGARNVKLNNEEYPRGAFYFCVSKEISEVRASVTDFWNILKQPISPAWYDMSPPQNPINNILWGNHRFAVPSDLLKCVRVGDINLLIPHSRSSVSAIMDLYRRAQLVIGTGRWVYEALASGRATIISDGIKTVGYIYDNDKYDKFGHYNMTVRHPASVDVNWDTLIKKHCSRFPCQSLVSSMRTEHLADTVASKIIEITGA